MLLRFRSIIHDCSSEAQHASISPGAAERSGAVPKITRRPVVVIQLENVLLALAHVGRIPRFAFSENMDVEDLMEIEKMDIEGWACAGVGIGMLWGGRDSFT